MITEGIVEMSNGSPEKRHLENGYHHSGSVPKYKIRKVSAVRDFPPGCGPNAPPINSDPVEDVVQTVGGDNVGQEGQVNGEDNSAVRVEALSLEGVKPQTHESLDDLVENAVAIATDGLINDVEELKIDVQPLGFTLPNGFGNSPMDVSMEMKEAEAQTVDEEAEAQIIDQECGEVKGLSSIDRGVSAEKKSVLESGGAAESEVVLAESLKEWLHPESSASDSIKFREENSPTPKDKFRTRRVSAVRDFPPFCGPNAPQQSKYVPEPQTTTVTPGSVSMVEFQDIKVTCDESPIDMGNVTPLKANTEVSPSSEPVIAGGEELEISLHDTKFEKNEAEELVFEPREKSATLGSIKDENHEVVGNEIVPYTPDNRDKTSPFETALGTVDEISREVVHGIAAEPYCPYTPANRDKTSPFETASGTVDEISREVVHGLAAEPYCPWRQGKLAPSSSLSRSSDSKGKKNSASWRPKSRIVAKKSVPKANFSKDASSTKREVASSSKTVDERPDNVMVKYEGGCDAMNAEPLDSFPCPSAPVHGRREFDVSLPPFGPNTSSFADARNIVRETLRLFQAICRKLLQGEEAKSGPEGGGSARQSSEKAVKRIDLMAAKIIKEKGKLVNTGMQHMGAVPGVEVGDEFQYRVELAIVGVHRIYQGGIDYLKRGGTLLVTSIVASGGYADDLENADVLVYSGQGGNIVGKNKQPEDQKLERGNLALKNSISERNPVRVIRGSKEMKASSDSSDGKDKIGMTYVYDGLYTVERFWTETGPHGKMVFKFELRRIPGQPELAWKQVKLSKKSHKRQGVCVEDLSGGKETFPVCAVNTIDSEKPPTFTYITKMMHPDWFRPIPPKGCDCTGRCSDSRKCSCAVKNGGEIPYNYNGAIVEAKPLVYECGPGCKCPPSCYNRVSQRGTKMKIEIFKTESRGWGVRSLSFIPSGSFICEYTGELLEDKDAEQRTNDEYLFDIGRNYIDYSFKNDVDVSEEGGYTIDAAQYGNIGRFVNHSCTPNLYAQNVLYDHEDTRMPHIMLFAAENIPALQELTYHYNYMVDQVRDSNGNIKKKSCFCGSAECTGRLY